MIRLPLAFILLVFLASCGMLKKTNPKTDASGEQESISLSSNLIDAKREMYAGNNVKAEELLQKCIKENPRFAVAWYELSFVLQNIGKPTEATEAARKAATLENKNQWFLRRYAIILEQNGTFPEAISVYKQLEKLDPSSYEHSLQVAKLYVLSGKYEDAIAAYNAIEKNTGVHERLSLEKERLYLRLGKRDKALAELEKLSAAYPEEFSFKGRLAEAYEQSGQKEKAYKIYHSMLVEEPRNGMVHLSLAGWYRRNGDLIKSAEETRKAFESEQADIDTKIGVLVNFHSMAEKDSTVLPEALSLLNILETMHNGDPRVYSIKADYFILQKKHAEARECLRKLLQIDSLRYPVWESLLMQNIELNDFSSLLEESGRALQLFPEQATFYYYQAKALFHINQHEEALEALVLGKSLAGRNIELLFKINALSGDIYLAKNNREKARLYYRHALELNPSSAIIRKKLDEL